MGSATIPDQAQSYDAGQRFDQTSWFASMGTDTSAHESVSAGTTLLHLRALPPISFIAIDCSCIIFATCRTNQERTLARFPFFVGVNVQVLFVR
jgi:hypothetical protein